MNDLKRSTLHLKIHKTIKIKNTKLLLKIIVVEQLLKKNLENKSNILVMKYLPKILNLKAYLNHLNKKHKKKKKFNRNKNKSFLKMKISRLS